MDTGLTSSDLKICESDEEGHPVVNFFQMTTG